MNIRIILSLFLCVFSFSVLAQNNGGKFQEFRQKKQQKFQNFQNEKHNKFDEFRRKINEGFAISLEGDNWEFFDVEPAKKRPIEKDVQPVIYDEQKHKNLQDRQQPIEVVPYEKPESKPQPEPVVPIPENDEAKGYNTFTYYGTKMQVRWGDLQSFKIGGNDDKALANAFRKLTETKYNNLLSDCLKLRKKYNLCDWAYYKMLEALAVTACGKNTNEATFVQGVLYQQSGYTMRFAKDKSSKELSVLVKANGIVYNVNPIVVSGKTFFVFKDSKEQQLKVCNIAYKDERDMQMVINQLPLLDSNHSDTRNINSMSYNIKVKSVVNKNLLDFMKEYPKTYDGKNHMTHWAYYANTPVSREMQQNIYPQLKERLQNTNELTAVNMLLNWAQTGFEYEIDEKVWGYERAFFAEETLFYPFSDCEDRAILFSHLVRDLVGLDVVLVYYPGHLAAAVCFNEDVKGDFLMLENKKFVIADPCYIRARVGSTMPGMDNKIAKIILCKR